MIVIIICVCACVHTQMYSSVFSITFKDHLWDCTERCGIPDECHGKLKCADVKMAWMCFNWCHTRQLSFFFNLFWTLAMISGKWKLLLLIKQLHLPTVNIAIYMKPFSTMCFKWRIDRLSASARHIQFLTSSEKSIHYCYFEQNHPQ